MHVPFGGQSRGAAFSDDNQPSRMQIRNTVNRANNYNLTAHVGSAGVAAILTEVRALTEKSYRGKAWISLSLSLPAGFDVSSLVSLIVS